MKYTFSITGKARAKNGGDMKASKEETRQMNKRASGESRGALSILIIAQHLWRDKKQYSMAQNYK